MRVGLTHRRNDRGRWPPLALAALAAALCVLASPTAGQAQAAPAQVFWLAESRGLQKIDRATVQTLLDLTDLKNRHKVAADGIRSVVWGLGQGVLNAYSFSGQVLVQVRLPLPPGEELDDEADDEGDDIQNEALAVNTRDGSVWVGIQKSLYRYSSTGALLKTVTLSANVQALAMDAGLGRVWVGTQKSLVALSDLGQQVASIAVPKGSSVRDLSFDKSRGQLWVAYNDALKRYAPSGNLVFTKTIALINHLSSDQSGGLWLAVGKTLQWLDAFGVVQSRLAPFAALQAGPSGSCGEEEDGEEEEGDDEEGDDEDDDDCSKIVAIVADPGDLSVWAASKWQLARASTGGQVIGGRGYAGVKNHDLALSGQPPSLAFVSPAAGRLVTTNTPPLLLTFSDPDGDADPSSIAFTVNGRVLPAACTASLSTATCVPGSPLPEGAAALTATISDLQGMFSLPARTSFTVDSIPPVISFTAPAEGALTGPAPSVQVSYADSGTGVVLSSLNVFLNGTVFPGTCTAGAAAAACTLSGPLLAGAQSLSATIKDQAGNTSSQATRRFQVNGPPIISGTPAASVLQDQSYIFAPMISDPDLAHGDSLAISVQNLPPWARFDASTGRLSGTPRNEDVGIYPGIVITVTDSFGLAARLGPFPVQVSNVNDPPVISGAPPASVNQDQPYSFVPTASDPDLIWGDGLTFNIQNKPAWADFDASTGALNGTPRNQDVGTYFNVILSVQDTGGLTASLPVFSITVVNVNDPPVLSGTPAASVNQGQPYSFVPTASDPDQPYGDTLTFRIQNKPAWAVFGPGTGALTGTPGNAGVGVYPGIVITVVDRGGLFASLPPFLVRVNALPLAEAGADAPDHLVETPLPLDGRASYDPDAWPEPLSYQWAVVSRPAGARAELFNPAAAQTTLVPDVSGLWAFELTVSDGQGFVLDQVQALVQDNAPPLAAVQASAAVRVGASALLDGSASYDPDGRPAPLTYQWTLEERPAGSTAQLTFATSAAAQLVADLEGYYRVRLTVSDGRDSAPARTTLLALVPGVFLTSPAEGALSTDGTITAAGTAASEEGVTQVTLQIDAAPPEALAITPGSFQVSFSETRVALPDGFHSLTVTATGAAGSPYSASRNFRVDTRGPLITVTTPQDGASYPAGSLTAAGTVTDESGVASLTVNGLEVPVAFDGSFQTTLAFDTPGPADIAFAALDTLGHAGTALVSIVVEDPGTAPVVQITSPADGLVTDQAEVTVSGTVQYSGALSSFTAGGVLVPPPSPGGSFSAQVPLVLGTNPIEAQAVDSRGRAGWAAVTVVQDLSAPNISINSPADGTYFLNTSFVTLTGSASDDVRVASVYVNGQAAALSGAPAAPSWSAQVALAEGPNTLTATAQDLFGRQAGATITLRLDTEDPDLSITSPQNNSKLGLAQAEGGALTVTGTASDENGIESLTVNDLPGFVDGGAFSQIVALVPGPNTITASSADGSGKVSTTAVSVFYDDSPPVITVSSPSGNSPVTSQSHQEISGTVTDNDTAALFTIDGRPVSLGIFGGFSLDAPLPLEGENKFTLKALDAAGNETLREVTIRRDTTPPQVVSITPENGLENIPVTTSIAVTYSEAINPAGLTPESIRVQTPKGDVLGTAQLSGEGTVLTITTSIPFDYATVIRVEVGRTSPPRDFVNLEAPPVVSSFRTEKKPYYLFGQVLGQDFLPITGAKVLLKDMDSGSNGRGVDAGVVLMTAVTDGNGAFEFKNPPPGGHLLMADARDVDDGSGLKFEVYSRRVFIVDSEDLEISPPLALPPMRPETASFATAGGPSPVDFNGAFQTENQGSLVLETQKAGSLTFPDGKRDGLIQAAAVPIQSVPQEIREAATGAIIGAYDLQPSGTKVWPPAKITLPNDRNLPVGTRVMLYSYSHDMGEREEVGQMEVVATEFDAEGKPTKTELQSLTASVRHFSLFVPEVMYPAVLPGVVAGYVAPPNPRLRAGATSPFDLQGIPNVEVGAVGPSDSGTGCDGEPETRSTGHYGMRCKVPGYFIGNSSESYFIPYGTRGLVWARVPMSDGPRPAYAYFQREVDFLPDQPLTNVNITVDIVRVSGLAMLTNLKSCRDGNEFNPGMSEEEKDRCTVVMTPLNTSYTVPVTPVLSTGEPNNIVLSIVKPTYKVNFNHRSADAEVPFPGSRRVPAGVTTTYSLGTPLHPTTYDPPVAFSDAGWVSEISPEDLFCNVTVVLYAQKPPYGVNVSDRTALQAAFSGGLPWDPAPLAVLENRSRPDLCAYMADGTYKPAPGVDMTRGLPAGGGSPGVPTIGAKIRVDPSGGISFNKTMMAMPIVGYTQGVNSAVSNCLASETAFQACLDPTNPAAFTATAEFVRRLNQVRFSPGAKIRAVVHHLTSGYVGYQDLKVPASEESRASLEDDGIRDLQFLDTPSGQRPRPGAAPGVRLFPPLVTVDGYKATRGARGEIRFGRGGWFYRDDSAVRLNVRYHPSMGFRHYCGLGPKDFDDKGFLPSRGYLSDEVGVTAASSGGWQGTYEDGTIVLRDISHFNRCAGTTGLYSVSKLQAVEEDDIFFLRTFAGGAGGGPRPPPIGVTVEVSQQGAAPFFARSGEDLKVVLQEAALPDPPAARPPPEDALFVVRAGNSGTRFLESGEPTTGPPPRGPTVDEQFLYVHGLDTEPYTVEEDPAGGASYRVWRRRRWIAPTPLAPVWPIQAASSPTPLLDQRVIRAIDDWIALLDVAKVTEPKLAPISNYEFEFTSFFRDTLNQRELRRRYDAWQTCHNVPGVACGTKPETTAFPCTGNHEHGQAFDISRVMYSLDDLSISDNRLRQIVAMTELDRISRQANLYWLNDPVANIVDVGHFDIDGVNGLRNGTQRTFQINQAQLDYRFYLHLLGVPLVSGTSGAPLAPIFRCFEFTSESKRQAVKAQ